MIKGMHGMFYSDDAEATREFLRDKLGFPFADAGGGWLIFDMPAADLGVHPAAGERSPGGTHDLSFYCDDIEETVAELEAKGVEFAREVRDDGFGYTTEIKVPGNIIVQLYQPKYAK